MNRALASADSDGGRKTHIRSTAAFFASAVPDFHHTAIRCGIKPFPFTGVETRHLHMIESKQ
jgi:hypothetical protein